MYVLAICRECDEPFLYWSITRPPPDSDKCEVCGGLAAIARGSDASDISALLDDVYRGAPQRTRKLAALRVASRIAKGRIAVVNAPPAKAATAHDAARGRWAAAGFIASTALLYVLTRPSAGGPSLDDQAREIALDVLRKRDAESAWIPGPGEPVPVLGKPEKPKRKRGNRAQNQKPRQTGTSGERKPKQPGSAKKKRK